MDQWKYLKTNKQKSRDLSREQRKKDSSFGNNAMFKVREFGFSSSFLCDSIIMWLWIHHFKPSWFHFAHMWNVQSECLRFLFSFKNVLVYKIRQWDLSTLCGLNIIGRKNRLAQKDKCTYLFLQYECMFIMQLILLQNLKKLKIYAFQIIFPWK